MVGRFCDEYNNLVPKQLTAGTDYTISVGTGWTNNNVEVIKITDNVYYISVMFTNSGSIPVNDYWVVGYFSIVGKRIKSPTEVIGNTPGLVVVADASGRIGFRNENSSAISCNRIGGNIIYITEDS